MRRQLRREINFSETVVADHAAGLASQETSTANSNAIRNKLEVQETTLPSKLRDDFTVCENSQPDACTRIAWQRISTPTRSMAFLPQHLHKLLSRPEHVTLGSIAHAYPEADQRTACTADVWSTEVLSNHNVKKGQSLFGCAETPIVQLL